MNGPIATVAIVLAAGIGASLAYAERAFSRARRRAVIVSRARHAARGEDVAVEMLEHAGYRVLGSQVETTYALAVDGEARDIRVRADHVAEKGGVRFVCEVKTGEIAPRIESPATRRQLLEYALAFDADGLLLIDADARKIHEVSFGESGVPARAPSAMRTMRPLAWLVVGLVAGTLVAVLSARGVF